MDTKYKLLEPMMTSNTTPEPFIVKASSFLNGEIQYSYRCFKDYNEPNNYHYWHSDIGSKHFIQIFMGNRYLVKKIALRRSVNQLGQLPNYMEIEISNDDINWTKIKSFIPVLSDLNTYYEFDLSDNTLHSSYIRFNFTGPSGYVALNRIKIYYMPDLFLIKNKTEDGFFSVLDDNFNLSTNLFNKLYINYSDFIQYGFNLSDINNKINNINKLDIINKQCDGDFKLIRKSLIL